MYIKKHSIADKDKHKIYVYIEKHSIADTCKYKHKVFMYIEKHLIADKDKYKVLKASFCRMLLGLVHACNITKLQCFVI